MNKKEKKMKKISVLLMSLLMAFALTACGSSNNDPKPTDTTTPEPTETTDSSDSIDSSKAINYETYLATALDEEVVVETYVQATQSWWDNQITIYSQDKDGGAYFIYNAKCSEEDAEKLVPGTKILVQGYKGEWAGEVEIMDAHFEIIEGDTFVSEPIDATDKLGTDELSSLQNQKVSFTGLTVEPSVDPEGKEVAFLYSYDGSGTREGNSDLYFNVSLNGETYSFVVESYLTNNESEVYKAVENLNIGDVIDCEGFLYWYEGVNPHITSISVK